MQRAEARQSGLAASSRAGPFASQPSARIGSFAVLTWGPPHQPAAGEKEEDEASKSTTRGAETHLVTFASLGVPSRPPIARPSVHLIGPVVVQQRGLPLVAYTSAPPRAHPTRSQQAPSLEPLAPSRLSSSRGGYGDYHPCAIPYTTTTLTPASAQTQRATAVSTPSQQAQLQYRLGAQPEWGPQYTGPRVLTCNTATPPLPSSASRAATQRIPTCFSARTQQRGEGSLVNLSTKQAQLQYRLDTQLERDTQHTGPRVCACNAATPPLPSSVSRGAKQRNPSSSARPQSGEGGSLVILSTVPPTAHSPIQQQTVGRGVYYTYTGPRVRTCGKTAPPLPSSVTRLTRLYCSAPTETNPSSRHTCARASASSGTYTTQQRSFAITTQTLRAAEAGATIARLRTTPPTPTPYIVTMEGSRGAQRREGEREEREESPGKVPMPTATAQTGTLVGKDC